jgi:hypothetical protein
MIGYDILTEVAGLPAVEPEAPFVIPDAKPSDILRSVPEHLVCTDRFIEDTGYGWEAMCALGHLYEHGGGSWSDYEADECYEGNSGVAGSFICETWGLTHYEYGMVASLNDRFGIAAAERFLARRGK